MGRILKVDLFKGRVSKENLKEDFYKKWLGGYGLGARIIYSDIAPKTEPLGPRNILGFTTGLFTGTIVPFNGSFFVVGKSPLTNTWGDSRGGGFFGPELKFAGYDAVFFYGRSKQPVYLCIHDGEIEIEDATNIWGKDTTKLKIFSKKLLETKESKSSPLVHQEKNCQKLLAS